MKGLFYISCIFLALSSFSCSPALKANIAEQKREAQIKEEEGINQQHQKYIGLSEEQVIKTFGFPTRIGNMNNGTKVLIYEKTSEIVTRHLIRDKDSETINHNTNTSYVNFFLNNEGFVHDWRTNDKGYLQSLISR